MGTEFIRSTAVSYTKQWSAEYEHAADDLFVQDCISHGQSFIVSPHPNYQTEEGEPLHVRLIDDRVFVLRDLVIIGEIERPTVDLRESLDSGCGIRDAFIDEVNEYAQTYSVCIGTKGK